MFPLLPNIVCTPNSKGLAPDDKSDVRTANTRPSPTTKHFNMSGLRMVITEPNEGKTLLLIGCISNRNWPQIVQYRSIMYIMKRGITGEETFF